MFTLVILLIQQHATPLPLRTLPPPPHTGALPPVVTSQHPVPSQPATRTCPTCHQAGFPAVIFGAHVAACQEEMLLSSDEEDSQSRVSLHNNSYMLNTSQSVQFCTEVVVSIASHSYQQNPLFILGIWLSYAAAPPPLGRPAYG